MVLEHPEEKEMPAKILIVEDDDEIIMLLSNRLTASGYSVLTAYDGIDGLNKARGEIPDLIILDISLPKMNGYELCRLLKFDEKYKKIPILILTAKGQQTDKEIGREVNADDYVTKPFDAGVLMEKIKALLKNKI